MVVSTIEASANVRPKAWWYAAWAPAVAAAFLILDAVLLAQVWYPSNFAGLRPMAVQSFLAVVLILGAAHCRGWRSVAVFLIACSIWPTGWVLAGYFHFVPANHAMAIAATWWALAIAIILVRARPERSPYLALAAVMAAVFPIATLAVGETVAPSEIRLSVMTESNDSSLVGSYSVQTVVYSGAYGTQNPEGIPWNDSRTVAFFNGQALDSVEFPSLLARGDVLWQRFLTEKGQIGRVQRLEAQAPVLDSMVTVFTLGQTRNVGWDGAVIIRE